MRGMHGWPNLMTGIKVGIYMISLGLGYIVAYLSEREEKDLKTLGRIIGSVLIVLSGFLIAYTVMVHLNKYGMGACGFIK